MPERKRKKGRSATDERIEWLYITDGDDLVPFVPPCVQPFVESLLHMKSQWSNKFPEFKITASAHSSSSAQQASSANSSAPVSALAAPPVAAVAASAAAPAAAAASDVVSKVAECCSRDD